MSRAPGLSSPGGDLVAQRVGDALDQHLAGGALPPDPFGKIGDKLAFHVRARATTIALRVALAARSSQEVVRPQTSEEAA